MTGTWCQGGIYLCAVMQGGENKNQSRKQVVAEYKRYSETIDM